MTEVNFYVLSQSEPEQRRLFACRLADKAFRQGHQVYVHTGSENEAAQMDELLWSFRPQSFIPHGLLGSGDDEKVAVGWQQDPAHHSDVLINLDLEVPDFIGRFHRVVEVVVQAPEVRDALRASWKFYQDRGYPLQKRDL
jgi:DNA polymerase-3 subunit chi